LFFLGENTIDCDIEELYVSFGVNDSAVGSAASDEEPTAVVWISIDEFWIGFQGWVRFDEKSIDHAVDI
jgi:hypothetical protein